MSHEMHHFDMGLWVLFLAYGTSIVGSFIGLSCARQVVSHPPGAARWRWLMMAALSIGGVGIWMTHFIAMMGFAVPGTLIRYDSILTMLSAVVAVVATLFGLWLVDVRALAGRRVLATVALVVGGVVMGLAVSVMHYSGMAAIRIQGELTYDLLLVAASVAIGIVAATAALWLARVADRITTRMLGALVMGCAVAALHYTGMAGVHVTLDPAAPAPAGVTVMSLMFPAYIIGTLVLAIPIIALLLAPHTADVYFDEAVQKWTAQETATGGYVGRSDDGGGASFRARRARESRTARARFGAEPALVRQRTR